MADETTGEKLKRLRPDIYRDQDPVAINQRIASALQDEGQRPVMLGKLRKFFPKTAEWDDDTLTAHTLSRTMPSVQAQQDSPAAQDMNTNIQRSRRIKAGAGMFAGNQRSAQGTQLDRLATEGEKANALEPIGATITPQEALDPRVPEFADFEEMKAAAKAKGYTLRNAGKGWEKYTPAIQMQDKTGRAFGQLRPGSSYDRSQVEGMPWVDLDQVTGAGDVLQQSLAETAASVYDPRKGTWFNSGPEYLKARGYGMKEYGRDAGQRTGAAFPDATRAAARVASGLAGAAAVPMAAIDKAEEGVLRGMDATSRWGNDKPGILAKWADENRDESAKYWEAAKTLGNQAWDSEALPRGPGTSEVYGGGMGEVAGEMGSMVAPTGGALVGGALGKYAIRPAVGMALRGAAKVGNDVAPGLMEVISNAPHALELPAGPKKIFDSAAASQRTAGDVLERQYQEAMQETLRVGTDASPAALHAADRRAAEVWSDTAARTKAAQENPLVGKALEDLQPFHEASFAGAGLTGPYNPLHVQRGQDFTKRHVWHENKMAQEAMADPAVRAAEDAMPVGEVMRPSAMRGVPGISDDLADRMVPPGGGVAAEVVAKRGRSLQDSLRSWTAASRGKDSQTVREMENMTASQMLARSARNVAMGKGHAADEAYRSIVKDIPELQRMKHVEDMDSFFWKEPTKGAPRVDVNGRVISPGNTMVSGGPQRVAWKVKHPNGQPGVFNLTQEAQDKLVRENKVVVVVDKGSLADTRNRFAGESPAIMHVPNAPKEMEGKAWNRQLVQAMQEVTNPTEFQKSIRSKAATLDRILGLSQLTAIVTRGNPGFEARNRTNEIIRLTTHDARWGEEANLRLVEEISNAPLGRGGRYVPELKMTTGEAHELLARQGALGKGIAADQAGMAAELGQAPWMQGKYNPLGAGAKLADVLATPGAMVGDAANGAVRHGLFPRLAEKYDTESGIRMAGIVNEMRHGVHPSVATANIRDLLIDFADKTPLEAATRPFVPFIKYYAGAVNGVARLALERPRQFSRVYDVMRSVENWDTDQHGGRAINKKFKGTADRLSGAPIVQGSGKELTVLRPETTSSEVANLGEMAGTTARFLTGSDTEGERGAAAVLGPAWTGLYSSVSGMEPATGRNVFGASKEDMERAKRDLRGRGVPVNRATLALALRDIQQSNKEKAGWTTTPMGMHPDVGAAWNVAATIPGIGRATMAAPTGLAYRAYNGGANPASRSEEPFAQMLERSARSYLTGMRSSTVDPSASMVQSQREMQRLVGKMPSVGQVTAVKGGKVDVKSIMDSAAKRGKTPSNWEPLRFGQ